MADPAPSPAPLASLTEAQRTTAWSRFSTLRPHVEDDIPLTRIAEHSGVPLRTLQRWTARYRSGGLAALANPARRDKGGHRLPADLVAVIEGMALARPAPSAATIHRRLAALAPASGWPTPSYRTVAAVVARLDPALVTLAHHGPVAWRDRFELVWRHRAERPNQLWQADHTQLDLLLVDPGRAPVRPWLTLILDDHSRAVCGYSVFTGAPSALNTALALRQAIWRKNDPAWPMCGLPQTLYADHGSDFTSSHLDQACADLHIHLIHSTPGRPQGRGKVERRFGGVTTELLPQLPGHLVGGKPVTAPALTLAELDAEIAAYLVHTYHHRVHPEIRATPHQAWIAEGWLPRMPDSLEALDLLLVHLATPRKVHRDGIHFLGLRYLDPVLAAYVGESVTLRYDPRDLAEIRVFHRDAFLCRAVNPEHAGSTVTLKDIEAARRTHRRSLRGQLNEKVAAARRHPPAPPSPAQPPQPLVQPKPPRLYTYWADKP